jgi:hypothetical protein
MKRALLTTASAFAIGFGAAALIGIGHSQPARRRRVSAPAPPPFRPARSQALAENTVLPSSKADTAEVTRHFLMYFVIPLWAAAGIADWLCHQATDIEHTTGAKESLIHLLMMLEAGVPLLAGVFLEITSPVLALMIASFLLHEATALWDVSYAVTRRNVTPIEQHVHSFMEIVPLMAVSFAVVLHWPQFLALFGLNDEPVDTSIRLKQEPLPLSYIACLLSSLVFLEGLPYLYELWKGFRENDGRLVPAVPSPEWA